VDVKSREGGVAVSRHFPPQEYDTSDSNYDVVKESANLAGDGSNPVQERLLDLETILGFKRILSRNTVKKIHLQRQEKELRMGEKRPLSCA